MDMKTLKSVTDENRAKRSAMTSPVRLEIVGLFAGAGPLSISDMAQRMGRSAGSLYHHVGLLEEAGILRKSGTRPKGKRFETLYEPAAEKFTMEAGEGDAEADAQAVQTIKAALRMTLRDFEAGLANPDSVQEGPDRNLLVTRLHMCASPRLLARLNEHLDALNEILREEAERQPEPGPDSQHLSLTLALLPLKGRGPERK